MNELKHVLLLIKVPICSNDSQDCTTDIFGDDGYSMIYFVRHFEMDELLLMKRRVFSSDLDQLTHCYISMIVAKYLDIPYKACFPCNKLFEDIHEHNFFSLIPR